MRSATWPSVVPRKPRSLKTWEAARTISRRRSTYSGRPSPSAAARRRPMLLVLSSPTVASLLRFVRTRHKPAVDTPPRGGVTLAALERAARVGACEQRRRDHLTLGE